jgi:hypothetical protein
LALRGDWVLGRIKKGIKSTTYLCRYISLHIIKIYYNCVK